MVGMSRNTSSRSLRWGGRNELTSRVAGELRCRPFRHPAGQRSWILTSISCRKADPQRAKHPFQNIELIHKAPALRYPASEDVVKLREGWVTAQRDPSRRHSTRAMRASPPVPLLSGAASPAAAASALAALVRVVDRRKLSRRSPRPRPTEQCASAHGLAAVATNHVAALRRGRGDCKCTGY